MKSVRLVEPGDATAIAEIYRPYVLETAISFETDAPSPETMQERISRASENFPWLAYEKEGAVLGYAYAAPWKDRSAYQWSVETSVYVRQGHHGQGIGRALYKDLLQRLKDQGRVNVIGGIALPNEGSVALHESMGFKPVARFKEVGFKFGQWWDVGYWQLQFPKRENPKPPFESDL